MIGSDALFSGAMSFRLEPFPNRRRVFRRPTFASAAAAFVALVWAAGLSAQSAPRRSSLSVVAGVVLDAATDRPVAGAAVTTNSGVGRRQIALTDSQGRFAIRGLETGIYRFYALKSGYLLGAFGRAGTLGFEESVELGPDQQLEGFTIWMWRPAIISGRVTDERDRPMAGVAVTPVPERAENVVTDDRGQYELRLPAGEYAIAVSHDAPAAPPAARDGSPRIYATTFHPSAQVQSSAVLVRVRSGDRREDIDIKLVPSEPRRLSGAVQPPPGPEEVQLDLTCVSGACALGTWRSFATADGRFEFPTLPMGQYMLLAYPRRGPSPSRATDPDFAMIPLSLTDGDITGLAVTLRQGPNVSGRIEFEGEPPGSRIGVSLDSLDADSTTAGDPDAVGTGMVLVRSVRPGRYQLRARNADRFSSRAPPVSPDWRVRTANAQGHDVICQPLEVAATDITDLEVTMTRVPSTITGTVQGVEGHGRAVVVLFPVDVERRPTERYGWSPCVQRETLGPSGRFQLSDIPDGDYFIAAIDIRRMDEWPTASFLDAISQSARRVSIVTGRPAVVDLRVSR